MKRPIAIAAIAASATGAVAVPAQAHHDSTLPGALGKQSRIKDLYPSIAKRWPHGPARKWRLAARTRWMGDHACDPRTLTRRFELGVWGWRIIEKRWACQHVVLATRSFLRCIAGHEGGHTYPDVWYGGSRGWQGGRFAGTDRVVDWFQIRPYWARLTHPEATERVVTWRTFKILTNPVDAADTAVRVGPSAYATMGMSS